MTSVAYLQFDGPAITCLPNYPTVISSSIPPLSTVPLCNAFNSNGCEIYWNIAGNIFYDADSNCVYGGADVPPGSR